MLIPGLGVAAKLLGALALCLVIEALYAAHQRPLFSKELRQDLVFAVFKLGFFAPLLVLYSAFYVGLFEGLLPFTRWRVARDWHPAIQFVVGFLAADFMVYVTHVLKHKVRALWHFHTVHHSQRNLNPLTTHRTHVFEDLVEDPIQFVPLALLGVGYPTAVAVRAFNWFWAHLIHSNVRWNLGALRWLLVSPQYHRIHHSLEPEHQDRNFGERLTLWDRLFGTLHGDFECYPETGVNEASYPIEQSGRVLALLRQYARQYAYPFRRIFGRS